MICRVSTALFLEFEWCDLYSTVQHFVTNSSSRARVTLKNERHQQHICFVAAMLLQQTIILTLASTRSRQISRCCLRATGVYGNGTQIRVVELLLGASCLIQKWSDLKWTRGHLPCVAHRLVLRCLTNFALQGMSALLFVLEPFCLCQCSPTSVQINRPLQIFLSFRFIWFFVKIQPCEPLICNSLKIPTFALCASRKRCLEHTVDFIQWCFLDAQTFHSCQKFVWTRKHLSSGCRPLFHLAMSSPALPSVLPGPMRAIQVVVTGCNPGVTETQAKVSYPCRFVLS